MPIKCLKQGLPRGISWLQGLRKTEGVLTIPKPRVQANSSLFVSAANFLQFSFCLLKWVQGRAISTCLECFLLFTMKPFLASNSPCSFGRCPYSALLPCQPVGRRWGRGRGEFLGCLWPFPSQCYF